MSEHDRAAFLGSVPLLAGRSDDDLLGLARWVRPRKVADGEVLWSQGAEGRELAFVLEGTLAASLEVPGDRAVEMGRVSTGDVLGEICALDGAGHTMTVRAKGPATVLVLGRHDFDALLARSDPTAFELRRRLAAEFARRLRNQLARLAATLGGDSPETGFEPPHLERCGPADSGYLSRMGVFHDFDPVALWSFLTLGTYAMCPPGTTLLAEGSPSSACYLTINGAVEKVLVRGERRVRVGLAGPGKAFGYEGLVDGRPSPYTATTRERTLLLVIQHDRFAALFEREDTIARMFLDVLLRDLTATLRITLRPHARLAASL